MRARLVNRHAQLCVRVYSRRCLLGLLKQAGPEYGRSCAELSLRDEHYRQLIKEVDLALVAPFLQRLLLSVPTDATLASTSITTLLPLSFRATA